ncbi:MAG: helix-turn-helix transcriptional regulator [Lachnospiraceae bacterium]|nr:helix-turn-helix transcriptional regulator [Lachnospiraceae bacterium]
MKDKNMEGKVGGNIRKYREKSGLTQSQLAKKIGVEGSSRISNWEQGANNPPADMIADICEALNVSASELLGIRLADDELTAEEKSVIKEYRTRTSMQHAVKVLLGIENV